MLALAWPGSASSGLPISRPPCSSVVQNQKDEQGGREIGRPEEQKNQNRGSSLSCATQIGPGAPRTSGLRPPVTHVITGSRSSGWLGDGAHVLTVRRTTGAEEAGDPLGVGFLLDPPAGRRRGRSDGVFGLGHRRCSAHAEHRLARARARPGTGLGERTGRWRGRMVSNPRQQTQRARAPARARALFAVCASLSWPVLHFFGAPREMLRASHRVWRTWSQRAWRTTPQP